MSYENNLRVALTQAKEGKDISREAGAGVWANYVRATCYIGGQPSNVEELDKAHKTLVDELNSIKELSKEEKNSLRSAKSVVGKAVTNNVDVWQRDDSGSVLMEDGFPMPKGKSELQEAKSDFERMLGFIEAAQKKYDSETRDSFSKDELQELWGKIALLADSVYEAKNAQ